MQKIVGAKKIGENELNFFSCGIDVKLHDKIVVLVNDFQTIVEVFELDAKISKSSEDLGKVVRLASKNDIDKYESLKSKAKKELPTFKKKSLELGLMMKFIQAEYSLDGSKILIVFSSEERVDFRQLLKELASSLKTRIELKQIGQRDEVKLVGGVGPCGEPCCCARFLKDFEHVTVKQAKIQGLSLSPTKINGLCGRLMCCLGYESKTYEETLAKMPKVNSEVETAKGKGVVVYNDILRERVSVKRQVDGDSFIVEEFELYDIKGFGEKPKKGKTEVEIKHPEQKVEHAEKHEKKREEPKEILLGAKEEKKDNKEHKSNFNHNKKKKFFNKNNKKEK